jgi:hypothetical protein
MDDFSEIGSYNNLLSKSDPLEGKSLDEKLKSEKFRQFLLMKNNTKTENKGQIKRYSSLTPSPTFNSNDQDFFIKIMVKINKKKTHIFLLNQTQKKKIFFNHQKKKILI